MNRFLGHIKQGSAESDKTCHISKFSLIQKHGDDHSLQEGSREATYDLPFVVFKTVMQKPQEALVGTTPTSTPAVLHPEIKGLQSLSNKLYKSGPVYYQKAATRSSTTYLQ